MLSISLGAGYSGVLPGKSCDCARGELSEAEEQQVNALKSRDREVRAHEQAHASVGGQYAGTPSYSYQTGPDGKQYAIGGEVPIDASPVSGDPEATIEKMQVVERAALAPAEPSSQDRKVAAEAQARRMQAQAELLAMRSEERAGGGEAESAEKGYAEAAEAVSSAPAQEATVSIAA